ncbi:GNAT family N-acetyltransferase [Streptomyces sp. NPDC059788]|uniref:GNAT family N-acetyltransferase n=1 Tax=Streptomyces sp. NPDC059788 TaxID=3346948 RepID=UPI0036549C95
MDTPAERLRHYRVELRRWRTDDIDTLDRLITESRDHLRPWMAFAAGHDRERGREFLARCEEEWTSGEAYRYAITTDGVVVGSCGLMRRIGPGGLELGYWLHHARTGEGLATVGAGALVREGLRLPGIDHIEIRHDEANVASGGVARRLGFREVGRGPVPVGAVGEVGVEVRWRLWRRVSGLPA